jgi:hypothetical protein
MGRGPHGRALAGRHAAVSREATAAGAKRSLPRRHCDASTSGRGPPFRSFRCRPGRRRGGCPPGHEPGGSPWHGRTAVPAAVHPEGHQGSRREESGARTPQPRRREARWIFTVRRRRHRTAQADPRSSSLAGQEAGRQTRQPIPDFTLEYRTRLTELYFLRIQPSMDFASQGRNRSPLLADMDAALLERLRRAVRSTRRAPTCTRCRGHWRRWGDASRPSRATRPCWGSCGSSGGRMCRRRGPRWPADGSTPPRSAATAKPLSTPGLPTPPHPPAPHHGSSGSPPPSPCSPSWSSAKANRSELGRSETSLESNYAQVTCTARG